MPTKDMTWFLAEVLGGQVSKDRAYQVVREYGVPHIRIGRRIYFDEARVEEWKRTHERGSDNPIAATRPPMPRGPSKAAGGALNSESCLVRTHPVNKDETDTRREGNDRNSK